MSSLSQSLGLALRPGACGLLPDSSAHADTRVCTHTTPAVDLRTCMPHTHTYTCTPSHTLKCFIQKLVCSPACLHLPGWEREGEAAGALPLLELALGGLSALGRLPWGLEVTAGRTGRRAPACAQRVRPEKAEDGKAAPSSWLTRRQSIFKLISLT